MITFKHNDMTIEVQGYEPGYEGSFYEPPEAEMVDWEMIDGNYFTDLSQIEIEEINKLAIKAVNDYADRCRCDDALERMADDFYGIG